MLIANLKYKFHKLIKFVLLLFWNLISKNEVIYLYDASVSLSNFRFVYLVFRISDLQRELKLKKLIKLK